jgi:hypothetical protein
MQGRRLRLWLGLLIGVAWASPAAPPARAQGLFARPQPDQWQRLRTAAQVPLEELPPALRADVQKTLERPTLFASGPGESFLCRPELYTWLLDHPDRAVHAWRRLGAACLNITDRGGGRFGWSDGQGSDIVWETVYRNAALRVWYAQGQVKPGPMLPVVPARAVVVMHHTPVRERADGTVMYQQTDVFVHTDSKTAALVTRLMGPSAPRLAEQNISQLQMFFSSLAWYCQRYPDRTEALLRPPGQLPTATQGVIPAVFPDTAPGKN